MWGVVVVGAVAAAIALVTATVVALNNFISTTINIQQSTLMQKLSDNTNFPDGQWPVSTADMSDDHGGWQVT